MLLTETAQPGDAAKEPLVFPLRTKALLTQLLKAFSVSRAELMAIVFVGLYLLNLMLGTGQNDKIAIKWAKTFCSDGQVLERNFAQLTLKADGATEVRHLQTSNLQNPGGGFWTFELNYQER